MVERLVANEKVEGSTPFARSKIMEKIDLENLEGKNFKEIVEFAENLSSKNLEDKINAYKILEKYEVTNN